MGSPNDPVYLIQFPRYLSALLFYIFNFKNSEIFIYLYIFIPPPPIHQYSTKYNDILNNVVYGRELLNSFIHMTIKILLTLVCLIIG